MADARLTAPDNYNDAVQNRVIRHMLYLESLKTRQAREVLKFIDEDIIPDLIDQLNTRLARIERFGLDRGVATTQRLESMIGELSAVTSQFKDINTRTQGELFDLAKNEVDWQKGVMNAEAGVAIGLTSPAPALLRTAVFSKPFDGRTLEQWYDRLADGAQARLAQEVRRGVAEGQTTGQIVRNIRNGGYVDVTRRQAEAIARSATSHVSNVAREALYDENEDIIKGVQWVATLDSRTCLQCAPLDGKVFPVGKGPRPPLHVSCRCSTTPVTKSFRQLGIDIDDIPADKRASMNGQVASDITYNQWLKKQPLSVQEMALGKTRAQLFRNGGLDVDQFTNRNRNTLTLDQLKKLESDAFDNAHL